MRKNLFFWMMLLCMASAYSQTTWTGAQGASWSDPDNWSTNAIPGSGSDVVIPSGSNVEINGGSCRSIQVLGNTTLSLSGSLAFTEASSFSSGTVLTWNSGSLTGGGTLTNSGTINLVTTSNKSITGATVLVNNGNINITMAGDLAMSNSTINNTATGVIDMRANDGNFSFFSGQGTVNNAGLISRTTSSGTASISVVLNNTGTVASTMGTLIINNSNTSFTSGEYNVSAGAAMLWQHTISATGTLTGTVNGDLMWEGNLSVPASQTATFDFSGSEPIKWTSGALTGGGTLENLSTIALSSTSNKSISGGTTLINENEILIQSSGDIAMSNSTLNNTPAGIIRMQADDGNFSFFSGQGTLNNSGVIERTSTSGTATIGVILNNTGTITSTSGTLSINNSGTSFTGGIYNVSSGAKMRWLDTITCTGTLVGSINGDLDWEGTIAVPASQTTTFDFEGTEPVNMIGAKLLGGGTLVNLSTISNISSANCTISGSSTLSNLGTFNMASSGDLYMSQSTFNNMSTGVLDMQADSGNFAFFSGVGTLNNAGLIKRSTSSGTAAISAVLNNTGTIDVESGTLEISNADTTLSGGFYHVAAGSNLNWIAPLTCTGTLTGELNGALNWNSQVNVEEGQSATFDFTGSQPVFWNSGSFLGGGTLTNASQIELATTSKKSISGSTLVNSGILRNVSTGDLSFSNSTLNNLASGIIDLTSDNGNLSFSSSSLHVLNNSGLMKSSAVAGTVSVGITVNNDGVIDVQSGTLQFSGGQLNNNESGTVMGIGTLSLPSASNYTNSGTFSPGGSPGTLTIIGNQESTPTSILAVELNGTTQGSQYDHLSITGNATMGGVVNVTLGFAPELDSEFTVATTSGLISGCTLEPTTSAAFGNMMYTFSVTCEDDNKVVLRTVSETLSVADNDLSSSINFWPNPVRSTLTIGNIGNHNLQKAEIFDYSGRMVQSVLLNGPDVEHELNLENLSLGVYLLKITSDKQAIIKRLIKADL